MSKLNSKERSKIPSEEFAGPGRSFPIEDKDHAEAAILDAPKAEAAGSITSHQEAHTRRMLVELRLSPALDHRAICVGYVGWSILTAPPRFPW